MQILLVLLEIACQFGHMGRQPSTAQHLAVLSDAYHGRWANSRFRTCTYTHDVSAKKTHRHRQNVSVIPALVLSVLMSHLEISSISLRANTDCQLGAECDW